jgi:hypothetical protein
MPISGEVEVLKAGIRITVLNTAGTFFGEMSGLLGIPRAVRRLLDQGPSRHAPHPRPPLLTLEFPPEDVPHEDAERLGQPRLDIRIAVHRRGGVGDGAVGHRVHDLDGHPQTLARGLQAADDEPVRREAGAQAVEGGVAQLGHHRRGGDP